MYIFITERVSLYVSVNYLLKEFAKRKKLSPTVKVNYFELLILNTLISRYENDNSLNIFFENKYPHSLTKQNRDIIRKSIERLLIDIENYSLNNNSFSEAIFEIFSNIPKFYSEDKKDRIYSILDIMLSQIELYIVSESFDSYIFAKINEYFDDLKRNPKFKFK